jgi:hypothetical protein
MAREARVINRLGQVLGLAGGDACHWMALCAHFGETRRSRCGHCAWCNGGGKPAVIPPRSVPALGEDTLRQISALRWEYP